MFSITYGQIRDHSIAQQFRNLIDKQDSYKKNHETILRFINDSVDPKKEIIQSLWLNELSKFNYRHKDYSSAISNQKKAIVIQKKFTDTLPSLLNKSYNNLAYFYRYSGDESSALTTFKTLIKLPYKDTYTIRAYAIGITDLLINRGDYFKLRDYLLEAERMIIKSSNRKLQKELYRIYLSLSRVYYFLHDPDELFKSIEYLGKAETFNSLLALEMKIIINNQYGNVYDELGELHKAITYYKRALKLYLSNEKYDKNKVSLLYNNLGIIYARLGESYIAYGFYEKALQFNPINGIVYNNLGDYHLSKKEFKVALENYQKAIDYRIGKYDNHNFEELQDIELFANNLNKVKLVNNLKDKANAWLLYYKNQSDKKFLENALTTIGRADELIDLIRSESTERQSKFFWRKKGIDLYMLATDICYELNQPDKAFYFMEKSKSLALLENLSHEEAKRRGNLPDSLQEKEYQLRKEIAKEKRAIISDTSAAFSKSRSVIFEKKQNYEAFITSLEKDYPGYYNFKKKVEIASLTSCKKWIINDEICVMQYMLSENKGYGIFVSNKKTQFFKIEKVSELLQEIQELRELLYAPLFSETGQMQYQKLAKSIFQKLFPFLEDLDDIRDKKLCIVPDRSLQLIPFEALVTNFGYENIKKSYLLNFCEINYLYSVSMFNQVKDHQRFPKHDFLGMAPISFIDASLPALSRSEAKMKKANSLFSGQVFLRKAATKQAFINELAHYKMVHISSHASAANNKDPWIAMYDEKIMLNELYFIKNQADLVILDACETGKGELQIGEGVQSLTRGFFHSGAKSVISSLWNTNEKASDEIIQEFYQHIKEGTSKSAALRMAKLHYLHQHHGSETSPYFWTPLVLTGDMNPIAVSAKGKNTFWLIGIGILGLIALLFWGYLKKRNTRQQNAA